MRDLEHVAARVGLADPLRCRLRIGRLVPEHPLLHFQGMCRVQRPKPMYRRHYHCRRLAQLLRI